jgi:hypothetical protein
MLSLSKYERFCFYLLAHLFWGELHGVICALQRKTLAEVQAEEVIAKLFGYRQRHRERQGYLLAHQASYLIGSRGIGSANRCIAHVRLERSGT